MRCLGLVEAPGTAPGSAVPIPCTVYRHSRLPDPANIGLFRNRATRRRRVERVALGAMVSGGERGRPFRDGSAPAMPLTPEQKAEIDRLRTEMTPTRRPSAPALEDILYLP